MQVNVIKGTWKLINLILSKRKSKLNPKYVDHRGVKIDKDSDIAHSCNDLFVNIGNNTAAKLPPSINSFQSFLAERCSHSFFSSPITEEEIINVVSKFKSGKAPSYDEIISVLKQAKYALAKPLALLFK